MADLPTAAPRRIDLATFVLLALGAAIAVLAIVTLVQVDAAAAAARDGAGRALSALNDEGLTPARVLEHLDVLRRAAAIALASAVAVVGAALLLRRASRRSAEGRW